MWKRLPTLKQKLTLLQETTLILFSVRRTDRSNAKFATLTVCLYFCSCFVYWHCTYVIIRTL